MHISRAIFGVSAALSGVSVVHAELPHEPADSRTIIVFGRSIDLVGIAQSGSQGIVGYSDFDEKPLGRVGELVENVPGVIATQHSGTGKANQYFLRGFNLDHGTDFAGFVDGVPINMRSHGHGQGYLDFNFLIPELVERVDYRKGPYFADVGDFSAAGTVKFTTIDHLDHPFAEATVGMYGYYRGVVAGSSDLGGGNLLVGIDATRSNGPWDLDEDLKKINALVKYSDDAPEHSFSITLSAYRARWQSTDQIPLRAISAGLIGRFGNIDPFLGGETTRIALSSERKNGATELSAYALYYKLRLTSNFTYFLDDPVNGDEFQQRDRRGVFGGAIRHKIAASLGAVPLALTAGAEGRYDAIGNVGLYRSRFGRRTGTLRQDRVDEFGGALWAEAELTVTPRLRAVLGVRGDLIGWNVRAEITENSGKGHDAIVAPKAALAWRPFDALELYANYGESYHSNDARGATISVDPASGDPAKRVNVIARATGYELGARVATGAFTASLVGFYLKLDSELVFVGDAGSTEPNDASRRYGVETTAFWRPTSGLTLDVSAALTNARFRYVDPGFRRIPGSVNNVVAAGATLSLGKGLSLTARVRHFGKAPLIEDGSVHSAPTTLVNAGAYWRFGRVQMKADILNLFDTRDADITYFYESQLANEAEPVADRHFHPVEPRQVRVSARLNL